MRKGEQWKVGINKGHYSKCQGIAGTSEHMEKMANTTISISQRHGRKRKTKLQIKVLKLNLRIKSMPLMRLRGPPSCSLPSTSTHLNPEGYKPNEAMKADQMGKGESPSGTRSHRFLAPNSSKGEGTLTEDDLQLTLYESNSKGEDYSMVSGTITPL